MKTVAGKVIDLMAALRESLKQPVCPSCHRRMTFDGLRDAACTNEDCCEYGQPYSLEEIENRTQSKAERGAERDLASPPMSMGEQHAIAWREHREARS